MQKITDQLQTMLDKVRVVAKHSTFIIIVLLLGFLIYSVYSVSTILERPSDANYRDQHAANVKTKFDQTTVNLIQNLNTSQQSNNNITFSAQRQRQNPFTEQPYKY